MNKIILITGKQGEGKTTYVKELISILQSKGENVAGILAEGTWKEQVREAFYLVNIKTGEKYLLCNRMKENEDVSFRDFRFQKSGLLAGEKALSLSAVKEADYIFIDEVGAFELEGGGWAKNVTEITRLTGKTAFLTVRESFIKAVIARWNLDNALVINIKEVSVSALTSSLGL